MKRISVLWIAVLVAAGLVIAGCGSSDDSSTSASSGTTSASEGESGTGDSVVSEAQEAAEEAEVVPNQILVTEPVKPKAGSSIYHVACDLSLPGCAAKAKSLEKAASAIGFDYEQCDGGSAADTIGQCFTNAINAKPDVIITNGIGVEAAGDGYAAAAKAKIPIIGMFTGNPEGVDGVATEVGGEACTNGARISADGVIADSEGSANVLFIGTQTYTCNVQRQESFLDEMKKCSECTTSKLTFSIASLASTLPQQIQAELQSNPDIEYIVGTFDAVANAAADAVRQAGKTNDIKVGGFDGDAPNLELIRNGEIQFIDVTTGQDEPGWVAIDAAARVINGEEVEPLSPVSQVMATANNIEEIGDAYLGSTGFEEQFKQLWGK